MYKDKKNYLLFLDLIKKLRKERGLTQKQLSDILNKPQSYISKIESGERRLDILEVKDICVALNIKLVDFAMKLEEIIKG